MKVSTALDWTRQNKEIQDTIVKSIGEEFPIESNKRKLVISDIHIQDNQPENDYPAIKDIKLARRTFQVPVYAKVALKDKLTGKIIDKIDKFKIANIPKMTRWYSMVIDGNEYQTVNQLRLKPGIYTRVKDNGNLESRFNLEKGFNFTMILPPEKGIFYLITKNAKYRVYNILHALGVQDSKISDTWGKEIFDKNKQGALNTEQGDIIQLYKELTRSQNADYITAVLGLQKYLDTTKVSPDTTKITLGKSYKKVGPDTLLATSKKLLEVMRGNQEPDERESLIFKELYGVENLATQYFDKSKESIVGKIRYRMDKKDKVREILSSTTYSKPIKTFFTQGDLSSTSEQTNPAQILASAQKVTFMGTGGIGSRHAITTDVRDLHPTHLNFIDPLATPECMPQGTDIFTLNGFKDISNVTLNDLVACNIDGRLEYNFPEKVQELDYDGPLYQFKNHRIHQIVTQGHRLFTRLLNKRSNLGYRFEFAEEVYGKDRLMKMGHYAYVGDTSYTEFKLDNDHIYNIDLWSSFMGWFLSKGPTTMTNPSTGWTCWNISQVNKNNVLKIKSILDKLGIKYGQSGSNITFNDQVLTKYLNSLGKCFDKYIPEELLTAPLSAQEFLMESLMLGDGRKSFYKAPGIFQYNKVYTTTSPRLANDVQRLAINLGFATSHKIYQDNREPTYLDIHEIRMLKHDETQLLASRGDHYVQNFKGKVYGITVPGGLLYTKIMDSSPVWTGNSSKAGVNLGLSRDIVKDGKEMKTAIRLPDGTRKFVTVSEFYNMHIGFGDQYAIVNKVPRPINRKVKGIYRGKAEILPAKDVEAWMFSPSNMFSYTTNLVPYIAHDSGNRIAMATRMLGQAIPIIGNEAPLIRTRWKGEESFQKVIGNFMNPGPGEGWSGTVKKIGNDYITLNLDKPDPKHGKTVKVGLFNNYPLNQESFIHNTPTVSVGEHVTPNKSLAGSNFTKDGVLALGSNVNVAYMPWKGLTFEDSAVVSDAFAKKYTSEKIVRKNIFLNNSLDVLDLQKTRALFPDIVTPENARKLDNLGLIKAGSTIEPGEALAAYISKVDFSDEEKILKNMNRAIASPYKKKVLDWDNDQTGKVLYVNKIGRNIDIHIKVTTPLVVGDKLSGMHGNKAIVSMIVPNDEMPHTKSGERMDMIFSPVTVPGRMNIGQVVEAAAGKLIAKTDGKPRMLDNFRDRDQLKAVYDEMKKKGIPVEEEMLDGKNGKPFGHKIFWGKPYILKLRHVVEHKLKSRNLGSYDINMQPSRGKESGQTMGSMEVMSMLSHGARKNLWEATALKGQENDEYWRALQLGLPTPPPKANFAFEKMLAYLKQAGVNIEKEGDKLTLMPMTDKEVNKISNGAVTDGGQMLIAKNLKSIPGGLFDPDIFGGSSGKKWGHINLAIKIPNPMMENAIIKVLDLTKPKFENIINRKEKLGGLSGPEAIGTALKQINVKSEIKRLKGELNIAPPQKINVINKKIRYLQALEKFNLTPSDYMIKKVPVLPPIYRPIYPLPSGDLMVPPINKHYRDVSIINQAVEKVKKNDLPEDEFNAKNEADLYHAVKALQGLAEPLTYTKEKYEGAIKTLAGPAPKLGFIHDKLFSKKQDMSARSTVGLDPSLNIDEVGLPEDMTKKLYKPFVVQFLVRSGMKAVDAAQAVHDWTPTANKALDAVISERPVLLNRAPTLHKHSIQAFKVKRVPGKTIKTNPLINSGFNLDFNGDSIDEKTVVYVKLGNKNYVGPVGLLIKEILLPGTTDEDLIELAKNKTLVLGIDSLYVLGTSKNNQVKYMKANQVSIHTSHGPCFKLKIKHNLPFICTEHHNISYIDMLTFKNKRIKTENLKAGAIIPLVRKIKIDETKVPKTMKVVDPSGRKWDNRVKINKTFKLDFNSGYWLGYFVGDGSITGSQQSDISQACSTKSIQDILKDTYFKTFNHISGHAQDFRMYPNGGQLRFSCAPLSRWMKKHFGVGTLNKQFPDWYLETPEDFRKGLVAGLMDSDGCVTYNTKNQNIKMSIQMITKKGMLQTQMLFRSLGIQSALSELNRKTQTNNNTVYMLQINPSQFEQVPFHEDSPKLQKYLDLKTKYPKKVSRDTHDLVPYNEKIHEELIKFGNVYKGKGRDKKLMNTLKAYRDKYPDIDSSTRVDLRTLKNKTLISRSIAKRLIVGKYVYLQDRSDLLNRWLELVNNEYIKYDVIQDVRKTARPAVTYDFSLPEKETFIVDGGIITHNTMAVHVPIGVDAVNEAWNMLPSKNIFKHGNNSIVPGLSQEYQFGLYWLTVPGKETGQVFDNIRQAKAAGLGLTDMFLLKGRHTSMGKEMINSTIPVNLRKYDKAFSKKVVNNILTEVAKKYPNDFPNVINSFKDLGNRYAHERSSTISLSDFTASRKYRDDILDKYKKKVDATKSKSKKIELWLEATDKIKAAQDKKFAGKNNIYEWLESGGLSGSKAPNVSQILSMPGIVSDVHGKPIEHPILKSFGEGLDAADYWNTMYGVRKGIIDTAVSTSGPGALSKALMGNVWSTLIVEEDCGTKKGLEYRVKEDGKDVIDRCSAETIPGIIQRNEVIDDKVYNKLVASRIITIKVRSPLTCEAPNGICQKDYGILPTGQFPEIGYNVGIADAHAITEKSTQLILRTKHTGAAFAGGKKEHATIGGFSRLEQLLNVPETVAGMSTLSPVNGTVQKIMKDSLGGYDVTIDGIIVNVPPGKKLKVKRGSVIKKGEQLSYGVIKPQDLASIKGHQAAQRQIIDEMDNLYQKDFHKRTFETVIRAISNNARITETPEKSNYLRGDVSTIQNLEQVNKDRKEMGLELIKYKPFFKSIQVLPQDRADWLSRVGTNHIVQAIRESAATGAATNIHGSDPIPAYLYGTEFGQKKGKFY